MNQLEREIHEFVCVRGRVSPLIPFFEELLTRYAAKEVFEATYRRYRACSDAEHLLCEDDLLYVIEMFYGTKQPDWSHLGNFEPPRD